ncbi:hypothetical protein NDU88_004767 [Pleurodeles waltl]|uniref:Uncharacterized protein n=1 Tax=Pleurodeles waltl TaxID=8319 RepID=A0AAV7V2B6_PLEWA|nr:hypothetical protein NDU88_004767 [Pleurodeles waltl]
MGCRAVAPRGFLPGLRLSEGRSIVNCPGAFPGARLGPSQGSSAPFVPPTPRSDHPRSPAAGSRPPPPGPAAEVRRPACPAFATPASAGGRVGLAGLPRARPGTPGCVPRVAVCGVPRLPALTASGAHLRCRSPPRGSGGPSAGLRSVGKKNNQRACAERGSPVPCSPVDGGGPGPRPPAASASDYDLRSDVATR